MSHAGMTAARRIESIDLVRGLIIVLMALDHSRDFFGDAAANPTNTATASAALFFTRWITHVCAPTFALLTGTGARLAAARMTKAALSRFLVTRGLWLLFLELVVMRFALQFNVDYHLTIVTVLWSLGWSMIVLAALVWLPMWAIVAFGFILVVGHNALDGIGQGMSGGTNPLWTILHVPGVLISGPHTVAISYVLIPWVGVTALGYALGDVFRWETDARRRFLLWLGIGLLVGFVLLRYSNLYGDPLHWRVRQDALRTVMSFLNTVKYPPSLQFLMMTLGQTMLLLRIFDGGVPSVLRPAYTIGKVPLFFYVLHFYLIHLLATAESYIRFGRIDEMSQSPDFAHFPFSQPPGWDLGLPFVYLMWASVVVIMYPLCRWYAGLKQRSKAWWLSYL